MHYEKYFWTHSPVPFPSGRVCRKAAPAATVWTNLPRLAEWRKVAVTGGVDHTIPYSVGAWRHTVSSSRFIQVVAEAAAAAVVVAARGGGRGVAAATADGAIETIHIYAY